MLKIKILLLGALTLGVFFGASYMIYLKIEPSETVRNTAQFFWTAPGTPLSEKNSIFFEIPGDNRWHEITVDLPRSVKMTMIRFDPIKYKLVHKVAIDWIRLVDAEGKIKNVFDFNAKDPKWSIYNSKVLLEPDGDWVFQPLTLDPSIVSRRFPEMDIKQIQISVLIQYRVIPYWDWLLSRP